MSVSLSTAPLANTINTPVYVKLGIWRKVVSSRKPGKYDLMISKQERNVMSDGECGAAPATQRVVGVIGGRGAPRPTSRAPSADITAPPVDSPPL